MRVFSANQGIVGALLVLGSFYCGLGIAADTVDEESEELPDTLLPETLFPDTSSLEDGVLMSANKTKKKGKKKRKKKGKDSALSADSAGGTGVGPRSNKSFELALELGYVQGIAFGLRGGFFLSPDLVLEGGFVLGSDLKGGYGTKTQIMEGRVKYFFAGDFYAVAGGGYRTFSDKTLTEVPGGENDYNQFQRSDLGLDVGVGSQWMFGSFTVGVDLAGYYLPIAVMGKPSEDPSPELSEGDQAQVAADFKKKAGSGSAQALRVYLGMVF